MSNIIRKLGGRRSALTYTIYALLGHVGLVDGRPAVDWPKVRRLVFVCSGNICRSPFAAEYCRAKALQVASFGLDGRGNASADESAQRVARRRGLDLSHHVSMSVEQFQPREGDLLIAMAPDQLRRVGRLANLSHLQGVLLGSWCPRPCPYIPDPYGMDDLCFEHIFSIIETAADTLLSERALALSINGQIGVGKDDKHARRHI